MLENYQLEDIARMKNASPKLAEKSDDVVAKLIHHWSSITYSASWVKPDERFIKWATIAPCDRDEI